MNIQDDFAGLVSDLRRFQDDLLDAEEDGLDDVGEMALQTKQEEVAVTYGRPEPRGSHRSGAWKEGQDIESERGERRIVTKGNASEPITNYPGGYEERLQDLPDGKDGINRSNPAADNALPKTEEHASDVFEHGFGQRLGL